MIISLNDDDVRLPDLEIKPFPLFVRPNTVYQGEYGFDFVRTSACLLDGADDKSICKDFAELDKQYEFADIREDVKYHIPWLCMFPNHKEVIGKDVVVTIGAVGDSDLYDLMGKDNEAVIETNTTNAALRCFPSNIALSELLTPQDITIFCDSPISNEFESIEFRLKSKFLKESDKEQGLLVGQVNVVKNSNYAEYKVPIYAIFAYLTDKTGYGYGDIEALINDSKIGGLQGIEDYLNKRSLNQALIQVKIKNITNPRRWAFTWNNSLKKVSEGINPIRNAADNVYMFFRDLIVNHTNVVVNNSTYFRYTHSQFSKMSFDDVPQRCAIIYLSSLNTSTAGGSSAALPTNNRQCIVYQSKLKALSTYAHELGHVFGLCHPFLERDNSGNEMSIQDNINSVTTELGAKILNIQSVETQNFNNNANYYINHRDHEREDRAFFTQEIQYWQDYLNEFSGFLTLNPLRFERGKTQNIMDYSRDENRIRFTKRQWEIMQKEVKDYYNDTSL
jgi:hypothetical protein